MRPAFLSLLCLIIASPALQAQGSPPPAVPGTWVPKKSSKAQIRAFDRLDLDNDELLSPAELLEVTGVLDGSFAETNAVIHAWFDIDETGSIDFGEWRDGRAGDGDPIAPDLKGTAFPELDANGNGKVSRQEFWKVVTRYVPAAITRQWYAAQFPGEQATGSSWQHVGGGTLTLVPIGGSGSIGGVVQSFAPSDPAAAAAWIASLATRDLTLSSGVIQSMVPHEGVPADWLLERITPERDPAWLLLLEASGRRGTSTEP